ncbi:MAG: hypothetical protein K6G24_00785 [Lachnospiraceae bacterium]|nr:hypothetical protein [Lachnospiraceae bacterium]
MEMTIAILSSSVLATIISGIFQLINNRKNKTTKLEAGMSLLLLASIKTDGKQLIEQGKVSKDDYDAFCAKYNAYKSLGGDGWADGIKQKVDMLERCLDD